MDRAHGGDAVTVAAGGPAVDGIVFDTPSRSKVVVAVMDPTRGPVFRTVHPDTLSRAFGPRLARPRASPSRAQDAAAGSGRGARRTAGRSGFGRLHALGGTPLNGPVAAQPQARGG